MFLRTVVRDRRVWLTLLFGVLAFVLARFGIPDRQAIDWVVKAGYWSVLVATAVAAYASWRTFRGDVVAFRWTRRHGAVAALIAFAGAVLLAHDRYGFKILADEELLAGTSMGMHLGREVAYPIRATDIQGPYQILQSVLDKRPFFYPFLVSVVHDLTGYRVANAFYLNTVFGFAFLALIYVAGRKLGGSPWAGALLVVLFAGLPLLSQQMKGGGFDLLNALMLTVVMLLAIRFAERRDEISQEALCWATVLLAYTRYESILFVVPVALLVLWGWRREQRVILSWPVVVAPLFLIFCVLQNRVFAVHSASWELAGVKGATTPFGWQYVGPNLGHALAFFFDTTGYQPNSPCFAAMGLIAVPLFGLWIARAWRTKGVAPEHAAVSACGAGLIAIWALLMAYFWGRFDDPLIHRLSLPVHVLFAIAIAVVGSLWLRRRGWQVLAAAAVIALIVYSLPAMSRGAYAASYSPAVEMAWRTEFLRRFPERDYLFIDNDATFWIEHKVPATPAKQAHDRETSLVYLLRNDAFSAIYVLQHYKIDPSTGARTLEAADDLGPDFELEPVWERHIQTLFIGRISRVVAIREGDKVVAKAGWAISPEHPSSATRSDAEMDAAKKAFVDNWLKQLP